MIGFVTSTIQVVLPAGKIAMSVYSAVANIIFKGKPFISAKNGSEPPIKNRIIELLWWITNLDLCNDESLIQPPGQVLIQTDASRKG